MRIQPLVAAIVIGLTSTAHAAPPEEGAGVDARGRATQARAGMPEVEQRSEQLPGAVAESARYFGTCISNVS